MGRTSFLYGAIGHPELQQELRQLNLTDSQRRALEYLRCLPLGLGLIHGPPGTGKTHFICQSLVPLMRFTKSDLKGFKGLILSPSNDPVNDLTAKHWRIRMAGVDVDEVQLALSTFNRLKSTGYPAVLLRTVYRSL
ncbi:MAG: DNA-binding protein SMUBP-2 [Phylliscum demangeonii]|nr:MAG: DNA-binding protein SMUBP-2 [Phylliscum demangeonii]